MLPGEREALTAAQLRRRFADLYLAPYEVDLPASAIGVVCGRAAELPPSARIGPADRLRLTVAREAGLTAEELLEHLRARIERRFRP
jgi:hypothetical protein